MPENKQVLQRLELSTMDRAISDVTDVTERSNISCLQLGLIRPNVTSLRFTEVLVETGYI